MKFYTCNSCGNVLTSLAASGTPCCAGEALTELIPGTVEASAEKHIPVVARSGHTVTVRVGSVDHPMVPAHFIQWVALQTNLGSQIRYLKPETPPEAVFALAEGEEPVAVYEYCNLHGLWMTEF